MNGVYQCVCVCVWLYLYLFLNIFSLFSFLFFFFQKKKAGSPIPPTVDSTNTSLPHNTKSSRHTRNSSTGHIPSPVPYTSPISIIPPKYMERRRSFDGQSSLQMETATGHNQRTTAATTTIKQKATPTPLSSVSARVTSPIPSVRTQHQNAAASASARTNQYHLAVASSKINTTAVPFPRGGRQIGATEHHQPVRRSASIERRVLAVEGKI